tara:strand:- start:32 stop:676 length:645 start_codon:yes stop_codon:yes gene_type:complete
MGSKNHYDEKYFSWQKKIGHFGGQANKIKFEKLIKKNDKVLDFGCGGGYLLSSFENIEKYGVEINQIAVKEAEKNGLKVYKSSKDLPDNYFDTIISNHALEHCENPLLELRELYRSLKNQGIISICIPCDDIKIKFKRDDEHMHLYSWSPRNLGNILKVSGFKVIESKPFISKWIPFRYRLKKYMSWSVFHILCKFWGRFDNDWYQAIAIAKKE